jgi:hypothetical protein
MRREKAIIPCELSFETKKIIDDYTKSLQEKAPFIGDHGLDEDEFWRSGLFRSAIEKIRGVQAATMEGKRAFVKDALDHLKEKEFIKEWRFTGAGERHDYTIQMPDGKTTIIETKGCLDGNNTNIFERPANADNFIIWSLCQNPGADPRKNAWSGIHTRLSAEIIGRRVLVDGLIIWDMICGTKGRPCPKLHPQKDRATKLPNFIVPPPCIYLFPHSVPDPRNNPSPSVWNIKDVSFLNGLAKAFRCKKDEINRIMIETRMNGNDVERRTRFMHDESIFLESQWSAIKRAR